MVKNIWKRLRSIVIAREAGQSLALIALATPVLLGFTGLSVDFGRLAVEQRKLQNYADSAALAGAQDLSLYSAQACTDAGTSLTANNNPGSVTCNVSQTTNPSDTITVQLSEAVTLDFLPVLGLGSKTVSATAVAITSSVTGCDNSVDNVVCAPYAAWRPSASSGCPDQFQVGMTIIFRDNGWSGDTGAGSCANWNVNSNDFKGFLRPIGSGEVTVGNNTITTHGGNACGQEPQSDIQAAATNHQDLVIPVIDTGTGNGNTTIHVPGFITISLNFTYQYPNQVQSVTLNGPPTGGTFTLTYGGQTTSPRLAYNASADTVHDALVALSSIGPSVNNVVVTGPDGGPYTIRLGGTLNANSLGAITASSYLTTGSSPAISLASTETDSSLSGTVSQPSDYTCPGTWYGMVVPTDVSQGLGGIESGAACNSTFYSCQIRLCPGPTAASCPSES